MSIIEIEEEIDEMMKANASNHDITALDETLAVIKEKRNTIKDLNVEVTSIEREIKADEKNIKIYDLRERIANLETVRAQNISQNSASLDAIKKFDADLTEDKEELESLVTEVE